MALEARKMELSLVVVMSTVWICFNKAPNY